LRCASCSSVSAALALLGLLMRDAVVPQPFSVQVVSRGRATVTPRRARCRSVCFRSALHLKVLVEPFEPESCTCCALFVLRQVGGVALSCQKGSSKGFHLRALARTNMHTTGRCLAHRCPEAPPSQAMAPKAQQDKTTAAPCSAGARVYSVAVCCSKIHFLIVLVRWGKPAALHPLRHQRRKRPKRKQVGHR
jgi:hypothetical protein